MDANTQAPLPIVDVMIPSGGGDQVAIPQINLSILGYGPNSLRDSHVGTPAMRAQKISILPQLDGPVFIPARDPTGGRVLEDTRFMGQEYSQGGIYIQGTSISRRREYPRESSVDANINRRPYRDWRPPERGRYPSQSGRPPDQRRYPNRDGRPPGRGGYPGGGPPDGGGSPNGDGGLSDGGGPPDGDEGPLDPPSRQGPPGPQGLPGLVRPIIVQTPQVTLDTSALENTFNSVG